jgi:hypothetical protein
LSSPPTYWIGLLTLASSGSSRSNSDVESGEVESGVAESEDADSGEVEPTGGGAVVVTASA